MPSVGIHSTHADSWFGYEPGTTPLEYTEDANVCLHLIRCRQVYNVWQNYDARQIYHVRKIYDAWQIYDVR